MTFQASELMLPVSLSRTGTGKKTKDAVEAEVTDMVMVTPCVPQDASPKGPAYANQAI